MTHSGGALHVGDRDWAATVTQLNCAVALELRKMEYYDVVGWKDDCL